MRIPGAGQQYEGTLKMFPCSHNNDISSV